MASPSIEEKLVKEVNSLLSEKVPIPSYEKTNDFQYMHATFYETLRLHPSVPNNFKVIIKNCTKFFMCLFSRKNMQKKLLL